VEAGNIMGNRTSRWTQSLSVGIPTLDDDHKTLIEMLDAIFIACQTGSSHVHLSLMIDMMLDHAQHHFDREEEIMAIYRYPELHRHLDEHAKLFIQLSEVLSAIKKDPVCGANDDVRAFLRNCLSIHIESYDRRYSTYIQNAEAGN
jgi:hemerythrin-like metal-binding protein